MSRFHNINRKNSHLIDYPPDKANCSINDYRYSQSKARPNHRKNKKQAHDKSFNYLQKPSFKDCYSNFYQPNLIPFIPYRNSSYLNYRHQLQHNNYNNDNADLDKIRSEQKDQMKRIEERIDQLEKTSKEIEYQANALRDNFKSCQYYEINDNNCSFKLPKINPPYKRMKLKQTTSTIGDYITNEDDEKHEEGDYNHRSNKRNMKNISFIIKDMQNSIEKDHKDMAGIKDDLNEIMFEFNNRLERMNRKHEYEIKGLKYILLNETKNSMPNIHRKQYDKSKTYSKSKRKKQTINSGLCNQNNLDNDYNGTNNDYYNEYENNKRSKKRKQIK